MGPTHDGVSSETRIAAGWPAEGPKLLWSLPRGTGYASPSIAGDKLVYQHRVDAEDVVECLDPLTGARRWQARFPSTYRDRYGYNSGPRATPLIDGGRVYVYSQLGVLRCLGMEDGAVQWTRDLNGEFKVQQNFFGVGTTPLLEGGLLIVNVGAPDGGPCVIGIDAASGKTVWSCVDEWGPSYASPVPATFHGKRRVLVFAGGESRPPTGGLLCLDPATGKADFRVEWRSRSYESVNAATPLVIGDQVLVTASYKTGGMLVTVNPDFTHSVAWTTPGLACHFSTPIRRGAHLYGFNGRNEPDVEFACVELATGKGVWSEQPRFTETWSENGQPRSAEVGIFRGQFLAIDGRVLCLGELGHLLWLDLNPTGYKEIARARLFLAPETWTPPVVVRGLLYVCQNHAGYDGTVPRLLCYDLRGE
jgi:outer membrane protein assembly factor BamB